MHKSAEFFSGKSDSHHQNFIFVTHLSKELKENRVRVSQLAILYDGDLHNLRAKIHAGSIMLNHKAVKQLLLSYRHWLRDVF
ncbi:hypothetical protein H5410_022948 [Solanum commersonii]|uniref:Uncharacterized protein n=1 Tax=Solanum commersonii TaxID=4109 RepID=A0A9J5ZFH5_SOLCO|nr:hypothetical protein H5410_022948 [Solanum commersonii]